MEDEQFIQAFGDGEHTYTGVNDDARRDIFRIKYNDDILKELVFYSEDTENFTNHAWRLLGRYIANNTHLEKINASRCELSDEDMELLFSELTRSTSLQQLHLQRNSFGIDGLRSMLPFLESSHLTQLILNGNEIGKDGCITISNLLQKENTMLAELYLMDTGIDDEGAEIIASSIKHNTKLKMLHLGTNCITEKGCKVFLKTLVDISSIDNTYTSNHTLTECNLVHILEPGDDIQQQINDALQINEQHQSFHTAGRAKVIKYQLNSNKRKEVCCLQGIEYTSIGILLANIEPFLLPHILALIGDRHGQSKLYTALIPMAPDLMSYIDRRAMLNDVLVKNIARATSLSAEYKHNLEECQAEYERKMAALKTEYSYETSRLTAHNVEVNNRLELIDLGDKKQSADGKEEGNEETSSSKKQRIS